MKTFLEALEKSPANVPVSYRPTYDGIVEKLCRRLNSNILQIDCGTGCFLKVLSECLVDASLTGLDTDAFVINRVPTVAPSTSRFRYSNEHLRMYQLDATDPKTPLVLGTSYDFIVDSSYNQENKLKALHVFAPYFRSGGYYVLENVNEIIRPQLLRLCKRHRLNLLWVDLRHVRGCYDDVLAVVTTNF